MKGIKAFLLGMVVMFSMTSCGLLFKQKQNPPETYGTSMRILYDKNFTYAQFDSICVVDVIPIDLGEWKSHTTVDYETNKPITEYLYIKSIDSNNEEIYRLIILDQDTYNIYKRITYGDKEE